MPYNADHLVTLAELKQTAQVFKLETDKVIKSLTVSGNTVNFYTTENGTGTPVATLDFPTELFLDQSRTQFVQNFLFNAATYPGAQNPSLDGKPVMVLAVKGTTDRTSGTASDTFAYSFLDMSTLVDTYETATGVSSQVLSISGYTITFKISSTPGNIISANETGIYATNRLDTFTEGNIVMSDANGAPKDGGILASDILVDDNVATMTEVNEMLAEVGFTVPSGN